MQSIKGDVYRMVNQMQLVMTAVEAERPDVALSSLFTIEVMITKMKHDLELRDYVTRYPATHDHC